MGFQLSFDDVAEEVIDQISYSTGRNRIGVVKDAIAFYYWIKARYNEGYGLCLTDKNNKPVREIVLPFTRKSEW